MFRSRCALHGALRGSAPQTFLYDARCTTTRKRLHPTRALFCVFSTPASAFSTTSLSEKADQKCLANKAEGSPTPSATKFSKPYTHENVFAHQAAAALNSLFGKSRLSASTAPMAYGEGATDTTDRFAAAVCSAPKASLYEEEECGSPVSHGEEELLADCEQPAQDMTNLEEASVTAWMNEPSAVDNDGEEGEHSASMRKQMPQAPERSVTTPPSLPTAYHDSDAHANDTVACAPVPVNLHGSRYFGEMATVLQEVALKHHFVSPIWSSKEAFGNIEAAVEVPDAEGVMLPTSTAQQIRVFNLEQTTLADELRFATVSEVRWYALRHHKTAKTGTPLTKPMNVVGGLLSRERTNALAAAPSFFSWQEKCPYWVSMEEVRTLGAAVRPEEEDNYILVPLLWGESYGPMRTAAKTQEAVDDAAFSSITESNEHHPSKTGERHRIYNLMQLQNVDGRFSQRFGLPPEKLARCYSIRGSRYLPTTTWLMWEYCHRYHFPLHKSSIVMLTVERISNMGGTVVQTTRHPLPPRSNAPSGDGGSKSDGFTPRGIGEAQAHVDVDAKANTAPEAGEGVVPPPFTMIIQGEVVSLYNALQTDIPEAVFKRVEEQRANRFRGKLAKVL